MRRRSRIARNAFPDSRFRDDRNRGSGEHAADSDLALRGPAFLRSRQGPGVRVSFRRPQRKTVESPADVSGTEDPHLFEEHTVYCRVQG